MRKTAAFLAAYADACALWRLYMPHVAMPGSSFFYFKDKPDWQKIAMHDVAIVQRCCTQQQYDFLKTCVGLGIKLVYDLDDNVWEVPPYNPAYATLMAMREGFSTCIRMVDAVVVSTRTLGKAVESHVKDFWTGKRTMVNPATGKDIPILLAENRIEPRLFAPPVKPDPLLVGWAGSSSHIGDLGLVSSALTTVASERPDLKIEFRGCVLGDGDPLKKLAGFRHKLWSPVSEYAARMPAWGWSVALAPVTDCNFNSSKSNIKMVEAGYCGIPCLASYVRPYDEFASKDRELKWLLCQTPGQWERKLRDLVNDAARREELGGRMKAVVDAHYSWSRPHEGWEKALEAIC